MFPHSSYIVIFISSFFLISLYVTFSKVKPKFRPFLRLFFKPEEEKPKLETINIERKTKLNQTHCRIFFC